MPPVTELRSQTPFQSRTGTGSRPRLIVFSDDWGRHPSSCQHLVKRLLPGEGSVSAVGGWDVLWINTIGMRRPRLTWGDVKRALGRAVPRAAPDRTGRHRGDEQPVPRVITPWMYPGFRSPRQRRFNAQRLTEAVARAMRHLRAGDRPTVALTTLPVTADLIDRFREHPGIAVDRWVYYRVDDFSVWPGTDGGVMDTMEREQVARLGVEDRMVGASEVLREAFQKPANRGNALRSIELLTHGVDLEHWGSPIGSSPLAEQMAGDNGRARGVFWGLIDDRLEADWLRGQRGCGLTWHLIGPCEQPGIWRDTLGVAHHRPLPYGELPAVADAADVLIMPYIDAPVTRAMQPLKLLEYLAAGWPSRFKPVVVRDLPATRPWADCCDLAATADEFARLCVERSRTGVTDSQANARLRRLPSHSWDEKASAMEVILLGTIPALSRSATSHVRTQI